MISRYCATQTLPQCTTEKNKEQRKQWSIAFHLFWEGAKLVSKKVKIVYFHVDEKWFASIAVRMNGKICPSLGACPVYHRIHHKNNIDKLLLICVMAIVPHDNDLRKGGRTYKLSMARCGGMVTAKKDTYKRVYKNDGSYHYPKIPENRLRVAGQKYFENWEITGSKTCNKEGKRKYALTVWLDEEIMPPLNQLCQQIEIESCCRVWVRGQWDNATPHVEKKLLDHIAFRFGERGWVFTQQPPNSPLTNIMDAAIFPSAAKEASALQGWQDGGRYLHTERLWQLMQRVWDSYSYEKIARAFVHHSQVAAAIYSCNGGDEFVQEHKGLSFGVRKVCRPDFGDAEEGNERAMDLSLLAPRELEKAVGVVVEEVSDGVDIDSTNVKKLKYPVPDMQQYAIADLLNYEELALIAGNPEDVDYGELSEAEKERYDDFVEAWELVQRQHHAPISGPDRAAAEGEMEEAAVEEHHSEGPEEDGAIA